MDGEKVKGTISLRHKLVVAQPGNHFPACARFPLFQSTTVSNFWQPSSRAVFPSVTKSNIAGLRWVGGRRLRMTTEEGKKNSPEKLLPGGREEQAEQMLGRRKEFRCEWVPEIN